MRTAHEVGFQSTATIMFGHVDRPKHWAAHHAIRKLQDESGGFIEFVPLPYVAAEAPMYRKGNPDGSDTSRGSSRRMLCLGGTEWRYFQHSDLLGEMGREGALLVLWG